MQSNSARNPASKTVSEINCAVLVHFSDATETIEFCAHFNIERLHAKQFQKWFMSSSTVPARKVVNVMRIKASARVKPLEIAIFAIFLDFNFQEIGAEQVHQVQRASFSVATYAEKRPLSARCFYTCSEPDKVLWL